jgi:DNA repair exonuclease SbcCD ATPase subunit
MLFTKLKLNYFGRFQNREIELKPGINLIYGENEAGKSTIHTFIKGMLFGIDRMRGRGAASKEDIYTRFLPWDYPGAYNGSMDIKINDKAYRLQRSFHANDKNFTILDLSTGREVKLKEGLISEMIPGLTESTFKNTISIEQLKAQTDVELAAQVRNYIANLSIAKSKEVNVAKAVSVLTDQKKQLEPTQNMAALKALQAEVEDGITKEEKIDQLTIQLRELQSEEQLLQKQKEAAAKALDNEATKRMEQLPAILEKYHSYQELSKQIIILEEQEKVLQAKLTQWEKDQISTDSMKDDINEAERLRMVLLDQEKLNLELQREKDTLIGKGKRNLLVSILPAFLFAILTLLITSFQPLGIVLSIVLIGVGATAYAVLNSNNLKKKGGLIAKETAINKKSFDARDGLANILRKHQVSRIEELSGKNEQLIKQFYERENAKEQQKELNKRKSDHEDTRDVLYESIMKYLQFFIPEEELTSYGMQRLQEEIRQKKQEIVGKQAEMNRQYDNCKLRIEKLRWEISALEGNEEQLLKNKVRYSELEQKQKESAVELDAIRLALSTIQELSTDIHDSFGQQLNQAVSEVISEVTGNKYTDLKVDEKLEVKVGWNGDYVLLDRLSAGTIDQVYFALRLAVADLLLGEDEVPLLFDDSFALYDEMRVKAALKKVARRKQIILFTCHKREQALLEELGLDYHIVDLSCR